MREIIFIVGPTASGKSDFAINLAQEKHGEIINADSLQVYRDLQILSARPTQDQMHDIPHHLYGFLDCHTNCDAAQWANLCAQTIKDIEKPLITGGTGMYIKVLTEGIHDIPPIPPDIQTQVRHMDINEVKAKLKECPFSDSQRMRRALCVQLATGKPLSYFYTQPKRQFLTDPFTTYFINPPRAVLHQRCADRFCKMIQTGAIEEVQNLMAKNPTGNVLQAIGIKEISAYLDGTITKQQMMELAVTATRQYAKRQITWFKNQLKSFILIDSI